MRYIKWGILSIIVFIVAYFIWQSDDVENIDTIVSNDEAPIVLLNPELLDYELNKIKWQISAAEAYIYEKKNVTQLKKINGRILSEDPRKKPTLITAESGVLRTNLKTISVKGNVHVSFDNGQKVSTEELIIDQRKETIYNQVDVIVESKQDTITASSMNYDIKKGRLFLVKPRIMFIINP